MKAKRILFSFLLTVFICSSAWWVVYFPYNRERLYRGMPFGVKFVAEHQDLAGRWADLSRNSLIRNMLGYLDLDPGTVDRAIAGDGVARMMEMFAARNTVIGYTPNLNLSSGPAWVFSTWIGWRGQLMKWGWFSGSLASSGNFEELKLSDGRRIWVLDVPRYSESGGERVITFETVKDMKLSLGVVEGVLLGCLSSDPKGVRYLMDRVARGDAVTAPLRERLRFGLDHVLDRGWFMSGTGISSKYEFTFINETGAEGWVKVKLLKRLKAETRLNQYADNLADLGVMLGEMPDAFLTIPLEQMERLLSTAGVRYKARKIIMNTAMLMADEDSQSFVCLAGGDYSGRILGLKVPAFAVGLKMLDEVNALEVITDTVDEVNAEYDWALVPRRLECAGSQITVLDSARPGTLYDGIGPDERAAFIVKNGWCVFVSNVAVLEKLLVERGTAGFDYAWLRGCKEKDAVGYAWINFADTGLALRNAIAVCSLALMAQGNGSSIVTRKDLDYMRRWIDPMSSMEVGSFWLDTDGFEVSLVFKFHKEGE